MGSFIRLARKLDRWLDEQKLQRSNETRRPLQEDFDSWFASADKRTGPRSREEIIAYLKAKNPHRWWRIQYDYRWVQKQLIRMGLNPDDARELL